MISFQLSMEHMFSWASAQVFQLHCIVVQTYTRTYAMSRPVNREVGAYVQAHTQMHITICMYKPK